MNARHFPAKGEKGVRFLFFRLAMGKRRLFSLHPCRQTVLPLLQSHHAIALDKRHFWATPPLPLAAVAPTSARSGHWRRAGRGGCRVRRPGRCP